MSTAIADAKFRERQLYLYVEAAGRPPREAPVEYAWQWRYRGRPSERDLLAELLQKEYEHPFPQEHLFGDDPRTIDRGS